MAQFDVHRARDGRDTLLLDCQANAYAGLTTRVVAPLIPRDRGPPSFDEFNRVMHVNGEAFVLHPQLVATVDVRSLGPVVASVKDQSYAVQRAFDALLSSV